MAHPFNLIKPTQGAPVPRPDKPAVLELPDQVSFSQEAPYLLSEDLSTVINVALALDQPLLVTGEPGCGKTTLAWAVARQLGTRVLEFHTKSISVARDLFYTFDAVRRFHDASVGDDSAREAANYVRFQALGEAFLGETTKVVLIDEVDKAPRDFPNDLLNELDRKEFRVAEVTPPAVHRQRVQHFILVTSNSERRLPAPFLRRCIYFHIPYPTPDQLREIVALHTKGLQVADSLVELAISRYMELRELEDLSKKPATGELIGWVRALHALGIKESELRKASLDRLPASEVLIKLHEDRNLLSQTSD